MGLPHVLFVRPSPLLGEGHSRVGAIFLLVLSRFFPRAQTPERADQTALLGGQQDVSFWPPAGHVLAASGTLAGG